MVVFEQGYLLRQSNNEAVTYIRLLKLFKTQQ